MRGFVVVAAVAALGLVGCVSNETRQELKLGRNELANVRKVLAPDAAPIDSGTLRLMVESITKRLDKVQDSIGEPPPPTHTLRPGTPEQQSVNDALSAW